MVTPSSRNELFHTFNRVIVAFSIKTWHVSNEVANASSSKRFHVQTKHLQTELSDVFSRLYMP